MIEIDGSFGEGGGQILRTSLALSLITGKPFRLFNIRANRDKPGLAPQHLTCVQAAAQIGLANVTGAVLRSRELRFEPNEVRPGEYHFPIGTAGATSLVMHTIYLPLMYRGYGSSVVTLEGGTHVTTSPSYHFLETTWAGYLRLIGGELDLDMQRPGFYPRGGGRVLAELTPMESIRPLALTTMSETSRVWGVSAIAGLPDHVAERQARRAISSLKARGIDVEIERVAWEGGPGSVLMLGVESGPIRSLFVGLGARGKPAEKVADEAIKPCLAHIDADAPVDPHSADQLVMPLALANGPSEFRTSEITQHLTTNMDVIKRFLDCDFAIDGTIGEPGRVRVLTPGSPATTPADPPGTA